MFQTERTFNYLLCNRLGVAVGFQGDIGPPIADREGRWMNCQFDILFDGELAWEVWRNSEGESKCE